LRRPPPGEEGFLQSHAGGEATLESLLESMTFSYVSRSMLLISILTDPLASVLIHELERTESRGILTHGSVRPNCLPGVTSTGNKVAHLLRLWYPPPCPGPLMSYPFQVFLKDPEISLSNRVLSSL